jgi:hypothetical protein
MRLPCPFHDQMHAHSDRRPPPCALPHFRGGCSFHSVPVASISTESQDDEGIPTLYFLILSSIALSLVVLEAWGCFVPPEGAPTPITASPNRRILSSGVSTHEESSSFEPPERAERPVWNFRFRICVGSILLAQSLPSGGASIQSSRWLSFFSRVGEAAWAAGCSTGAVDAPAGGGRLGPKSSSLSLSDPLAEEVSCSGCVDADVEGGIEGPITLFLGALD